MSQHPDVQRLRDGYDAFSRGDFPALDELFAEDIRWHSTGRNQLAGAYEGRSAVSDLFRRVMEVTDGSFRAEVRTVFADETDAVVASRPRVGEDRSRRRRWPRTPGGSGTVVPSSSGWRRPRGDSPSAITTARSASARG